MDPLNRQELENEIAWLRQNLKHYADTQCEGWCRESDGYFDDCHGCPARKALEPREEAEPRRLAPNDEDAE